MRGLAVGLDRRARLRRDRVLRDPQHRIARLGGPAGGRHRVLRAVGGGDHARRSTARRPRAVWSAVDRRGQRRRGRRPRRRSSCSRRARAVGADPDHLRAARGLGAGRRQRVERGRASRPGSCRRSANRIGARIGRADELTRRRSRRASRRRRRARPPRAGLGARGNTASATPAASAIASPPATRVVFLRREAPGSRAAAPACGTSLPFWPITGAVACAVAGLSLAAAAAAGERERRPPAPGRPGVARRRG